MHMTHKSSHLPQEIITGSTGMQNERGSARHRTHLKLPIKTVEHIMSGFGWRAARNLADASSPHKHAIDPGDAGVSRIDDDFLDIFCLLRHATQSWTLRNGDKEEHP